MLEHMKYHLFDAKKIILGRLAGQAAVLLMGKKNSRYDPARDEGDAVVVVNSDKIFVSGQKMKNKKYHHYSGYPSGIKTATLEEKIASDSREVVRLAVWGMLPKNKLRDSMKKRLYVYKDEKHLHKIDVKH